MSNAFEVTVDDVINVVVDKITHKYLSDEDAKEIHSTLNHDLIEAAALSKIEMEDQTKAAYDEIERQIRENNFI